MKVESEHMDLSSIANRSQGPFDGVIGFSQVNSKDSLTLGRAIDSDP